jgi:hypothetical protein
VFEARDAVKGTGGRTGGGPFEPASDPGSNGPSDPGEADSGLLPANTASFLPTRPPSCQPSERITAPAWPLARSGLAPLRPSLRSLRLGGAKRGPAAGPCRLLPLAPLSAPAPPPAWPPAWPLALGPCAMGGCAACCAPAGPSKLALPRTKAASPVTVWSLAPNPLRCLGRCLGRLARPRLPQHSAAPESIQTLVDASASSSAAFRSFREATAPSTPRQPAWTDGGRPEQRPPSASLPGPMGVGRSNDPHPPACLDHAEASAASESAGGEASASRSRKIPQQLTLQPQIFQQQTSNILHSAANIPAANVPTANILTFFAQQQTFQSPAKDAGNGQHMRFDSRFAAWT